MKKLYFLFPLFLIGCTVSQKITYQTDDLAAPQSVKTIPIWVEVQILSDNRTQADGNKILFTDPRQTRRDGMSVCINSEEHYKKDTVVNQISKMMSEHFNKARLFKGAFYNQSNYSGYYLTGTLNSFYGEQEFSTGALVGSQFGLVGALTTSGIKTPGKIIIDNSDIRLFKKDGTLVKDFGSFYKEYDEDMKADGYCWCIYANMNEKLKDFNSHLVEKIRADLADVTFE
jgi:hypothetical protein